MTDVAKEYKEYKIDAENNSLGRVASKAAFYLRGKGLASFAPNIVPRVKVKILNCGKVKLTGNKMKQKTYRKYSGYPGNVKIVSFELMFKKDPKKCMRKAVENMISRNRLRKKILKNLSFE